ncbi:pentatricopeptide repeat-containing protein At4g20770 [Aristolochia californica]|uniref:pentatricopeptide repeat-containing protein At4g20770 n=1 Tax=Aristolochia californica TaxID=171875 RepID=UPI0035D8EA74
MEIRISHARITQFANLLQCCIDRKTHISGKILHAQILRNDFSSDIFLGNKLIEFYASCGHLQSSRQVFDHMSRKNAYSWNAIIGALCKGGLLREARDVFVRMPDRNVVSYNTLISALSRNDFEQEALGCYCMMKLEGFMPTRFTLASVLSACGGLEDLNQGRRCHALVTKLGLDDNTYVENGVVGMYAKCGSIEEAIQAFNEISHPNEVSCTSVMSGLANTDQVEEALQMFRKMHKSEIQIDQVALSGILGVIAQGVSGEVDRPNQHFCILAYLYGQQVHTLVLKLGTESDVRVGNSLIDLYGKCTNMTDAELVFATMQEVNIVSWNILIAGYGQMGQSDKALQLLERMQLFGFKPDEVTYVGLLGACVRSGDVEAARKIFGRMSKPSKISWNAILSGYCQKGNYGEAIELFRQMQFQEVFPDRTTLAVILRSCTGLGLLEFGRQVHAASIRALLHLDLFVASGLVDMHSKCGNINVASRIFDRMKERDVVAWNSMMGGFALHSLSQEAFTFFKQMQEEAIRPTQFTYASLVSSCAKLSALSQGRQVHGQISKDGFIDDIYVGSALIDMYAKCGNIEDARECFDSMPTRNVISWNEMIHGYAQNGCGQKAINLFEEMLKTEEKPDSVTFISVLTACSHAGLTDTAIKLFDLMKEEYSIEPLADHYTCIIDALGRANRLEEAETLIENMPCKHDPIVWEVLLGACKVHFNVDLAKKAAEKLFQLDPQNSAPYVLLSNLYAALGRWNDVSDVRRLMSNRGVVKDHGYSWIEFKNRVQAFMVDDVFRTVHNEVLEEGIPPVSMTDMSIYKWNRGI